MNPQVDDFLNKTDKWQEELTELRKIILDCQLTEHLKWKAPCYTFSNKNILIIGGLKKHCFISFFKGVLLKDAENILENLGPNSRSGKIITFTSIEKINRLKPVLKNYIYEAIEVEKQNLKVTFENNAELQYPDELKEKFTKNNSFKIAFNNLTKGRQRGYLLFFSAAKQPKTRIARINKYTNRILNGKGMHDCVCGLSKKMPNCDGAHKHISNFSL